MYITTNSYMITEGDEIEKRRVSKNSENVKNY